MSVFCAPIYIWPSYLDKYYCEYSNHDRLGFYSYSYVFDTVLIYCVHTVFNEPQEMNY